MATGVVVRILCGAGLTVGLLAFGLELTGKTARARSFLDLGGPSLAALEGSLSAPAAEMLVDGTPTRLRTCRTSHPPGTVWERYRELAARESGQRPWVEAGDPEGGGLVAWMDEEGVRKSVRVQRAPCGSTYELLEAAGEQTERRLPADLPVPAGCQVAFSVLRADGTGVGFLVTPTAPDGAARRCLEGLIARGFTVDASAAAALDALEDRAGRACVPFAAPGRRGVLVVAPDPAGARLSLAIHPAA